MDEEDLAARQFSGPGIVSVLLGPDTGQVDTGQVEEPNDLYWLSRESALHKHFGTCKTILGGGVHVNSRSPCNLHPLPLVGSV